MAHQQQINFCLAVKKFLGQYFENKKVLDCGSLDINGNNRYLFTNCDYTGIDIGEGKNVDIVCPIHKFSYPDETFDTIISTECFEHDMFYPQSLLNICRLLKKNGLFLFTCATTGRPEHGTINSDINSSPLTSSISNWDTYYKNLTEQDIRDVLNVDEIFNMYGFNTNDETKDLYFWGIKK